MLKDKYSVIRNFSRRRIKQSGFTIIEMLAVFAIVAILTGLFLAAYRSGQRQYTLSQAAQQVAADLRKAQNMAMGGIEIRGQYYGYGIQFHQTARPTSYHFYADKNNDNRFTNPVQDNLLDTVNLPEGIIIQSTSEGPIMDIFFRPPDPTTYINRNDTPGKTGSLTLELEDDPSSTKRITITTAGRIQVD